jgi:hypothetical protein
MGVGVPINAGLAQDLVNKYGLEYAKKQIAYELSLSPSRAAPGAYTPAGPAPPPSGAPPPGGSTPPRSVSQPRSPALSYGDWVRAGKPAGSPPAGGTNPVIRQGLNANAYFGNERGGRQDWDRSQGAYTQPPYTPPADFGTGGPIDYPTGNVPRPGTATPAPGDPEYQRYLAYLAETGGDPNNPPGGGQQPPPGGGQQPPPGGGGTYPYNQYNPPAWNPSGYNYPSGTTPFVDTSGQNLDLKAANDRNMAIGRGEDINQQLNDYRNYQAQRGYGYEGAQGNAYSRIAAGQGGYTPEQKAAILREQELSGLKLSDADKQGNYLQDWETAGITGHPEEVQNRFAENAAQMDALLNERKARTYEALGGQDQALRGVQTDTAGNVRNSLDYGDYLAKSYLDPAKLGLSDAFNQDYAYTDKDVQALKDQAGRRVGIGTQANVDRIQQGLAASGSYNPLAAASAIDRSRQTGEVASADAMTDAYIKARQQQLDTLQQKEAMRLGAEQNYAGLGSSVGLNLGGRRTAAEEALGQQATGTEKYLGGSRLQGYQDVANALESGYGQLGQQSMDVQKWRDMTEQQRAQYLAENRQGTNRYNQGQDYTRGMNIWQAASGANRDVANTQLGQEAEYRKYLGDQQNQANQNYSVGTQQQIGNFGTQTGAQSNATRNAITNYAVPGLGEKIFNKLAGGGVVKGPRDVMVGEAGPELVIDLKHFKPYEYGAPLKAEGGGEFDPNADMMNAYNNDTGGQLTSGPVPSPSSHPWLKAAGAAMSLSPRSRANPLYDYIQKKTQEGSGTPSSGDQNTGQATPQSGGGILSGIASLASLFLGDGGVVAPESAPVAPGVDYVNGPQMRTLGSRTPQAVVPLRPGPRAKLTMQDLPALLAKYQSQPVYGY